MRVRRRAASCARWASSSARSATATEIVTALSVVLTCWPPGPPARAARSVERRAVERALAGGERVVGRGVGHSQPAAYHAACPASESASPPRKPLIGVIHLPGAARLPRLARARAPSIAHALAELATYRVGALDGVLVENEDDQPHRVEAGRETIAVMTAVTRELVAAARSLPVGIEILLNDPEASLAVALAAGAGVHPHRLLRRRDEPARARRRCASRPRP